MEILKEDYSEFKLEDGDIINAKEVSDLVTNSVSIEGSVFIPGIYDLSKVSTVGDLISSAKGVMPDALILQYYIELIWVLKTKLFQ